MNIDPKSENKYSLSVFFPFYNEEKNINLVIERAILALEDLKNISEYEIIIINDGSIDLTEKIGEGLTKKYSKVRIISHPKNLGYGKAIISGIKAARYDYIFFTDGDLQFDIKEINRLLNYIPEYKAVIGYRFKRKDSISRTINAKLWNIANRCVFGLKVKDIDCAFKLFEKNTIANLNLISEGAMISAEILIRLKNAGIKIKEVPVSHFPRKNGSPTGAKPTVIKKALKEFLNFYMHR